MLPAQGSGHWTRQPGSHRASERARFRCGQGVFRPVTFLFWVQARARPVLGGPCSGAGKDEQGPLHWLVLWISGGGVHAACRMPELALGGNANGHPAPHGRSRSAIARFASGGIRVGKRPWTHQMSSSDVITEMGDQGDQGDQDVVKMMCPVHDVTVHEVSDDVRRGELRSVPRRSRCRFGGLRLRHQQHRHWMRGRGGGAWGARPGS